MRQLTMKYYFDDHLCQQNGLFYDLFDAHLNVSRSQYQVCREKIALSLLGGNCYDSPKFVLSPTEGKFDAFENTVCR